MKRNYKEGFSSEPLELEKANNALQNINQELARSNTRLEEFAHVASHDLKEPIRKIHYYADSLKHRLTDRLGPEEVHLLDRIENSTDRMSLLVDDLLTYSQVSLTSHAIEEIDLNEKVRKVLGDLELMVAQTEARIEVGPLPTVKGFRRQLQQLFQNLISNALKYRKPGVSPVISLTSRMVRGRDYSFARAEDLDRPFHLIEVQDNGIGFEQANADRIFQMFQRLHGNKEYAGTGVGLAIAKKVVENHNGYLWAEGNPGQGATFRMLLPV